MIVRSRLVSGLGALILAASFAADVPAATIRPGHHALLDEVRKSIDKGAYAAARQRLDTVDRSKLNDYERAFTLQVAGSLHIRTGDYQAAANALEAALESDVLPARNRADTYLLLAQAYFAREEIQTAAAALDRWRATESKPAAESLAYAGAVYARSERLDLAADLTEQALANRRDPPAAWLEQLAYVYSQLGRHRDAAYRLTALTERFPDNRSYWLQLYNAYSASGQPERAASTLELAYLRGVALQENELTALVASLIRLGRPQDAGRLLADALETERVQETAGTLRLAAEAWISAKDFERALAALEAAAKLEPAADHEQRRREVLAVLPR